MQNADNTKLSELMTNSRFEIPDFQRNYEWESEQVEDLIDDLLYLRKNGGEEATKHYFGTFVLGDAGVFQWSRSNTADQYNVIDGQQRLTTASLFMARLAEELDAVSDSAESTSALASEARETASDIKRMYVGERKTDGFKYRLSPGPSTRTAYQTAIRTEGSSPEPEPDSHLAVRRIFAAQDIIDSRFSDWQDEHLEGESITDAADESLQTYSDFLFEITRLVNTKLVITVNIVEDMNEAARMFKVINERGKDLSTFDRVKSHIVYCASQSAIDTEEVSRTLENTVERITELSGTTEKTVDEYVRIHWTIFTGEYPARTRHRGDTVEGLIQNKSRYADPSRDDIDQWVGEYTASFKMLADHYIQFANPSKFEEKYSDRGWRAEYVSNRLFSISKTNNYDEILPALIAAKETFGYKHPKFLKLLTLVESVIFRYHHLLRVSGTLAAPTSQGAYEMFWADHGHEVAKEIFNGDPATTIHASNREAALNKLCDTITDKIEQVCDDDVIRENLSKDDVVDGNTVTNWTGVKTKEILRFLFYEYERHLRQTDISVTTDQPSLSEWNKKTQLERINPTPPVSSEHSVHPEHCDPLGNLTVAITPKVKNLKGRPLQHKKEAYEQSELVQLRQVANKGREWTQDDIERRREQIIEFILTRWPTTVEEGEFQNRQSATA